MNLGPFAREGSLQLLAFLRGALFVCRKLVRLRLLVQVLARLVAAHRRLDFDRRLALRDELFRRGRLLEVVTVVLMGLALSFLATLYPSWRAARLDPAEALRYE